jgi:hypothetical protein
MRNRTGPLSTTSAIKSGLYLSLEAADDQIKADKTAAIKYRLTRMGLIMRVRLPRLGYVILLAIFRSFGFDHHAKVSNGTTLLQATRPSGILRGIHNV